MKCLLIDDDPVFLAVGEAMLQSLGYEVAAVASNGEQRAQPITRAGATIDVVILDLNMPGFDADRIHPNRLGPPLPNWVVRRISR